MDREREPVVGAILTNMCLITDGERLVMEERIGKDYRGWILPGGHVEADESLADSVIREMREETGLTIAHPRLRGVKDWIREDGSRYVVFFYIATEFSGTLTASEEGAVRWVRYDELDGLNVIWNVREVIDLVRDRTEYTELFFDLREGKAEVRFK